jgi:hypothetical protein
MNARQNMTMGGLLQQETTNEVKPVSASSASIPFKIFARLVAAAADLAAGVGVLWTAVLSFSHARRVRFFDGL